MEEGEWKHFNKMSDCSRTRKDPDTRKFPCQWVSGRKLPVLLSKAGSLRVESLLWMRKALLSKCMQLLCFLGFQHLPWDHLKSHLLLYHLITHKLLSHNPRPASIQGVHFLEHPKPGWDSWREMGMAPKKARFLAGRWTTARCPPDRPHHFHRGGQASVSLCRTGGLRLASPTRAAH